MEAIALPPSLMRSLIRCQPQQSSALVSHQLPGTGSQLRKRHQIVLCVLYRTPRNINVLENCRRCMIDGRPTALACPHAPDAAAAAGPRPPLATPRHAWLRYLTADDVQRKPTTTAIQRRCETLQRYRHAAMGPKKKLK